MREDIIRSRGYPDDIAGDDLSLKIASYPATAVYLTNRLNGSGDIACELCCGIGISLIELAKTFKHVIGVDNDATILEACKTNLANASIENYNVLLGDISSPELLSRIESDVVLYDIPYWSNHDGKVDAQKQNPDLTALINNIRSNITSKIVVYAPPHMDYERMKASLGECEYVQLYVNDKYDRNLIFLGSLAKKDGEHKVKLYSQ